MHLEYTEKELLKKFQNMGTKEIIDYLMNEGLSLKAFDLSGLPIGIYRRKEGTDMVFFDGYDCFSKVRIYTWDESDTIEWAAFNYVDDEGDWWLYVLDENNYPVNSFDAMEFRMNSYGVRTG